MDGKQPPLSLYFVTWLHFEQCFVKPVAHGPAFKTVQGSGVGDEPDHFLHRQITNPGNENHAPSVRRAQTGDHAQIRVIRRCDAFPCRLIKHIGFTLDPEARGGREAGRECAQIRETADIDNRPGA